MQKIVNIIAIASGVVSLAVVGTAGYVYVQKDAIIESVKEKALKNIGGAALGGALGGSLPVPGLAPQAAPDAPAALPGLPFGG